MPANKSTPYWSLVRQAMLVVLVLAFWLRVHDLAGQSLWSEEGLYLMRGAQPAGLTLAGEIMINGEIITDNVGRLPPLLLNLYQSVVGGGAVTGRYFSVLWGVVAVALLFQLGRVTGRRRMALGAAFLLAISPYHIWLSREVGYEAFLLALTLIVAYAVYYFFISPESSRRQGMVLGLALAGLILVLASLPHRPVDPSLTYLFIPGRSFATHTAGLLGTGIAPDLFQPWWRYMPALILAVAGGIAGWRGNRRSAVFLFLFLGLLLISLGMASRQNSAANAVRLIFLALPPFLLLVAAGWLFPWQKWRGRALALGVVMVIIQIWWLGQQYTAAELRKDDVHTLAEELTELTRPGDAVVIQDTGTLAAFTQNYQGAAPWFLLPGHTQIDGPAGAAQLAQLGEQAGRVWLVTAPQPRTGFPPDMLAETARAWPDLFNRAYDWLWLPLEVALFAPRPEINALPPDLEPAGIDWSGELILEAFDMPESAASGELWQPRFVWRKTAAADGQYTLFVQLKDAAGKVWAVQEWLLWADYPPGFWPADALIRYEPVLRLPAGLPPGEYAASLQVVRTADGQPLSHAGGADLVLAAAWPVTVATAPEGLAALPPYQVRHVEFGRDLNLLGYALQADVDYRPGHPIPITLIWEAARMPAEDYRLCLELQDSAGVVINSAVLPLVSAAYPPTQWPAGALLAATQELLVPAMAAEGRYTLHVSVLPADSDRPVRAGGLLSDNRVLLTDVTVLPWPLETELPNIQYPLRAEFGLDPVQELNGYALNPDPPQPGQAFNVSLAWRAGGPTENGYTVFVHVTDPAGNLVAQGDGVPVNGTRPTTSWRPGEVLVDEHSVLLPETLPAGLYTLWVGFFNPQTGERLPVRRNENVFPDGRLPLAEFAIE